jgi:hypothetical protein
VRVLLESLVGVLYCPLSHFFRIVQRIGLSIQMEIMLLSIKGAFRFRLAGLPPTFSTASTHLGRRPTAAEWNIGPFHC